MRDINIIDKPNDKDYQMASIMTGLTVDEIKDICKEEKNSCKIYPVKCITAKCAGLEQCYGIQVLSRYR